MASTRARPTCTTNNPRGKQESSVSSKVISSLCLSVLLPSPIKREWESAWKQRFWKKPQGWERSVTILQQCSKFLKFMKQTLIWKEKQGLGKMRKSLVIFAGEKINKELGNFCTHLDLGEGDEKCKLGNDFMATQNPGSCRIFKGF